MNTRLASWKNNLLNRAWWLCLEKSVLTSLLVHAMKSLWLPNSICEHVEKLLRRCLWGKRGDTRSWHLVAWKDLTQPRAKGGLGIQCARRNNEALLGKLVRKMINEKDKLWVHVIGHKYLHSNSILTKKVRLGASYVWRGLLKARDAVAHGFCAKLGAVASSFWYSNGLGTGLFACRVPFVNISDTALAVADVWREGR